MDRRQLYNDSETALRVAMDGRQAALWTAMPAIVQSVDFSTMTIIAQIAIQGITTNSDGTQQYVDLPPLLDVPICFPSAGGFTLTFPIKVNDEVLVIIASRCIDAWWQNGGNKNSPLDFRMHDLSDGYAIPGPKSLPNVLSNISTTHAQLRNDAGAVYLEITNSGVNIVGNLHVAGTIISTGDVTGGGKSLDTHVHPVTTAPGTTGPPV